MSLEGIQIHLVNDFDGASAFMRWLGEQHEVIAVDTETEGLNPRRDRIRLIQFGDAMTAWVLPWERWSGLALEVFRRYEGQYVAHNAKFDVKMIERWTGQRLPRERFDDTRSMAHLEDPTGPTGLKPLGSRYIDRRAGMMQSQLDDAMAKAKWTWATVPVDFQPYWAYAGLDVILTTRLREQFMENVNTRWRESYDLELRALWPLMDMEFRGARIDPDYTQEQLEGMERYIQEAAAWVEQNYGCGPGQNARIVERLQADGIEFTKRTPKGAWSLDAEVLESMEHHPLAATVLQRRRIEKLAHTYLRNFLAMLESDGRLHAAINPLGARTGRMSMELLQTLPRKDEDNPLAIIVRNCFIASVDHKLVMADFDQIEMRLLAHFAADPGLIAAFMRGDIFTEMARQIYADGAIEKKDPRRQVTKNAAYAKAYGAGPARFAETARVSLEQGKAFLDQFDRTFPGVRQFQNEVDRVAKLRAATEGKPYVVSPFGRRQFAEDDKAYTLVNYLIQGTAAEIFKIKLAELDLAGLGEYMILPVHDEVVLDVPAELVEDATATIKDVMKEDERFAVPITVGVDVADRWGEKYG